MQSFLGKLIKELSWYREPEAETVNFAVAFKGASWTDPDAIPLMVMQTLIGGWNKDSLNGKPKQLNPKNFERGLIYLFADFKTEAGLPQRSHFDFSRDLLCTDVFLEIQGDTLMRHLWQKLQLRNRDVQAAELKGNLVKPYRTFIHMCCWIFSIDVYKLLISMGSSFPVQSVRRFFPVSNAFWHHCSCLVGKNSSSELAQKISLNKLANSFMAFNTNYHDIGLFGLYVTVSFSNPRFLSFLEDFEILPSKSQNQFKIHHSRMEPKTLLLSLSQYPCHSICCNEAE